MMGKLQQLAARRQAILSALDETEELSVVELSRRLDVSEVTIRQDLEVLQQQNLLLRTRGGAVKVNTLPELSFEYRQQQQAEQKARIGQAAAQLVRPGDALVIDASTTSQAMIPFLKNIPDLTVLTNSLKVSMSLLRMPQINVMMPGGSLRRDAISLIGHHNTGFFDGLNVRVGFFGARGITVDQGLTDINLQEAQMKRKFVEMCQTVVAVMDGSKWGQIAVVTFANLDEVQCIITDHSAPKDLVETVRARGVEVNLV